MLYFKKSIAVSLVISTMILSAGCGGGGGSVGVYTAAIVALEDLNNTNVKNQGYIINVDIDDIHDTYDAQDISYIYCTDGVGTLDYFAVTSDQLPWDGSVVPNYDYGELVLGTRLDHNSSVVMGHYTLSTTDYVEEGTTYNILVNYLEPGNEDEVGGTMIVNSINDFNCSTLVIP